MLTSNLQAARSRMALTLGIHILPERFGLCPPPFALIANARAAGPAPAAGRAT
jgi:hypothetical protein